MKDQINTIRAALEPLTNNSNVRKALAALDQIETMVGEQEPVAWMYDWLPAGGPTAYDWISWSKDEVFAPENCHFNIRPLYTAAPVAQQPQAEPLCEDEGCPHSGTKHVCISPPQAGAVPPGWTFKRLSDGSIGIHAPAPKPGEKYQRTSDCVTPGHGDTYEILSRLVDHLEAPQQAEAVPDDVGLLEYRGNSVSYIHQKMTAYRGAIDAAWQAMREAGHPPDGRTPLEQAITKALAPQQAEAVPPGYVLVPVEQFNACKEAFNGYSQAPTDYHRAVLKMKAAFGNLIDAALAAAPKGQQP